MGVAKMAAMIERDIETERLTERRKPAPELRNRRRNTFAGDWRRERDCVFGGGEVRRND